MAHALRYSLVAKFTLLYMIIVLSYTKEDIRANNTTPLFNSYGAGTL